MPNIIQDFENFKIEIYQRACECCFEKINTWKKYDEATYSTSSFNRYISTLLGFLWPRKTSSKPEISEYDFNRPLSRIKDIIFDDTNQDTLRKKYTEYQHATSEQHQEIILNQTAEFIQSEARIVDYKGPAIK